MLCLDGLRGLLATYVMLSHMVPLAYLPPWCGWLGSLLSHGQACVDVFFMLSGLVIVRSLASFGDRAGPFLLARATRIYPVYLVVLALAVPLVLLPQGVAALPWIGGTATEMLQSGAWPAHGWARLAAHLTMTHGLFPRFVLPYVWLTYLGAAWSLSTEWQFYVLIALVGGTRIGLWRLAALFLVLAALGAAWQAAAPHDWGFTRAFLPNKAHYFALGIAGAGLLGPERLGDRRGDWRGDWRYASVLAATLGVCALGEPGKLLPPLAWTACLLAQRGARPLRPLAHVLTRPWLLWLGAMSYCIYLVNQPVQKLLELAIGPLVAGDGLVFDLAWVPGAIAAPLLAAWWLHARIELPALRWGRNLATSRIGAPTLSAG